MWLLNEHKRRLDETLGAPTKAQLLVGGEELFEAEEAYLYVVGRFFVTVGFHGGVSRYACFSKDKTDDPMFDDRDVEVSLALISPDARWDVTGKEHEDSGNDGQPTDTVLGIISQYETAIKDSNGKMVRITAAHRSFRPHFLAYTVSPPPAAHAPVMSKRLEKLAREMNASETSAEKVDAVIAVINELLSERKR
jgi:hypothetical protein